MCVTNGDGEGRIQKITYPQDWDSLKLLRWFCQPFLVTIQLRYSRFLSKHTYVEKYMFCTELCYFQQKTTKDKTNDEEEIYADYNKNSWIFKNKF